MLAIHQGLASSSLQTPFSRRRSPGRPSHASAAQDMEVDVKHLLARIRPAVDNVAEALFCKSFLFRKTAGVTSIPPLT